jgi:hypothetical protein
MTETEEQEWKERLADMVAAAQRKQEAKRAARADHLRRRKYGKATLHAAKLARLRGPQNRWQG